MMTRVLTDGHRMAASTIRWLMLMCGAAILAACQTMPSKSGLNTAQIAVLQQQGFVETAEGWEFSVADKLLFASDSEAIVAPQQDRLRGMARALAAVGLNRARVEGHTDATGAMAYNQTLSLKRAQAVADLLTQGGIPAANLQLKGWGETKPVAVNNTADGRQENRRVVIIIPSA